MNIAQNSFQNAILNPNHEQSHYANAVYPQSYYQLPGYLPQAPPTVVNQNESRHNTNTKGDTAYYVSSAFFTSPNNEEVDTQQNSDIPPGQGQVLQPNNQAQPDYVNSDQINSVPRGPLSFKQTGVIAPSVATASSTESPSHIPEENQNVKLEKEDIHETTGYPSSATIPYYNAITTSSNTFGNSSHIVTATTLSSSTTFTESSINKVSTNHSPSSNNTSSLLKVSHSSKASTGQNSPQKNAQTSPYPYLENQKANNHTQTIQQVVSHKASSSSASMPVRTSSPPPSSKSLVQNTNSLQILTTISLNNAMPASTQKPMHQQGVSTSNVTSTITSQPNTSTISASSTTLANPSNRVQINPNGNFRKHFSSNIINLF